MHSISVALATLAIVFVLFAVYLFNIKGKLNKDDKSVFGQNVANWGVYVLGGLGLLAAVGTYMSARSPPDPLSQVEAAAI